MCVNAASDLPIGYIYEPIMTDTMDSRKKCCFDLKDDPYEQHNLAEVRKDICMNAVYLLNEWHDNMMGSMDCDIDPLWTVLKEGGPYHAKEYVNLSSQDA